MIPNNIFDTLIGSLAIAAVKATHVTDGDEQTRQLIRIREARDWLNQLLVTVPVDATIETLHQSCDELQMQLDSEKVNTEYTEQLYEQASQRIDELEQLQTQPTWERVVGDIAGLEGWSLSVDDLAMTIGRGDTAHATFVWPQEGSWGVFHRIEPQETQSHE